MITTLHISNIECYSYHGCLKEESIIGGRFSVDVIILDDFSKAVLSDDLNDTADYVLIHQIVRDEMDIASQLIEHVSGRILKRLSDVYSKARNITVIIKKYNPPVNGQIGAAIFQVSLH